MESVRLDIGTFKYILIEAKSGKGVSYFVRGSKFLEFHAQNFEAFLEELQQNQYILQERDIQEGKAKATLQGEKVLFTVLGGGRVRRSQHECFIYGYSQSYGLADHSVAQKMIQEHFKYQAGKVAWSNEGY